MIFIVLYISISIKIYIYILFCIKVHSILKGDYLSSSDVLLYLNEDVAFLIFGVILL